MNNSNLWSKRS